MRHLLREQGLEDEIEIDSAGTGGWHAGDPPDARATAAARRRGIALEGAARQVRPSDFEDYDLLLAADRENLARPARDRAGRGRRARRSGCCASSTPPRTRDLDVPDPYYGGPDGFEEVLDLVEAACRGLLAEVAVSLERRARRGRGLARRREPARRRRLDQRGAARSSSRTAGARSSRPGRTRGPASTRPRRRRWRGSAEPGAVRVPAVIARRRALPGARVGRARRARRGGGGGARARAGRDARRGRARLRRVPRRRARAAHRPARLRRDARRRTGRRSTPSGSCGR